MQFCKWQGHNRSSCTNNDAAKHPSNAHLVREATKKKKQDKKVFDALKNQKAMQAKVWSMIFIVCISIFCTSQ